MANSTVPSLTTFNTRAPHWPCKRAHQLCAAHHQLRKPTHGLARFSVGRNPRTLISSGESPPTMMDPSSPLLHQAAASTPPYLHIVATQLWSLEFLPLKLYVQSYCRPSKNTDLTSSSLSTGASTRARTEAPHFTSSHESKVLVQATRESADEQQLRSQGSSATGQARAFHSPEITCMPGDRKQRYPLNELSPNIRSPHTEAACTTHAEAAPYKSTARRGRHVHTYTNEPTNRRFSRALSARARVDSMFTY
jgi:hypothetical protein